jgi:hypothetical protein
MDDAGPSLARRALAVVVLVVVAIVAFRLALGVISAVFWMVAVVALIVAGLWALSTLKSAKSELRDRRAKPLPTRQAPPASPDGRVEAQMREIERQLREQGRL